MNPSNQFGTTVIKPDSNYRGWVGAAVMLGVIWIWVVNLAISVGHFSVSFSGDFRSERHWSHCGADKFHWCQGWSDDHIQLRWSCWPPPLSSVDFLNFSVNSKRPLLKMCQCVWLPWVPMYLAASLKRRNLWIRSISVVYFPAIHGLACRQIGW